MKKYIIIALGIVFGGVSFAYAVPSTFTTYVGTLLPVSGDNKNDIGTSTANFRTLYIENIIATSTTATSTFAGDLRINGGLKVDRYIIGDVTLRATGNASITGTLDVTGKTTLGYASTTQIGSTGSAYFATDGGNIGIGTIYPDSKVTFYKTPSATAGAVALAFAANNNSLGNDVFGFRLSPTTFDLNLDRASGGWQATPVMTIQRTTGMVTLTNALNVSHAGGSDYLSFDFPGTNVWRTRITADNSSSYIIGNDTGGTFNTKILTLTQVGNVGIGTTSPYAPLSVVGQIVGEYITATSTTATSTFAGEFIAGFFDVSESFSPYPFNKTFSIFRPIASTTPSAIGFMGQKFVISQESNYVDGLSSNGERAYLLVGDSGAARKLRLGVSNDFLSKAEIELSNLNSASGTIAFKVSSGNDIVATEAMRVNKDGNVGIGTTSPAAKLNVYVSSASSTPILLEAVSGGGCILVKDVAGAGYTQIYTMAGVISGIVHTGPLSSCN
jgi:hypothetical protein